MTTKEDFLDVDATIPGQHFVCLSFLSPETILKNKELYFVKQFLLHQYGHLSETVQEDYTDFMYNQRERLETDFQAQQNFQTTIRGIKIRGCYDTHKEAQHRAKELQKLDPSFHIFIGSVGYWLPWDPSPDSIHDQVYANQQLNELMKHYKENEIKRDLLYQQQKDDLRRSSLDNSQEQETPSEMMESMIQFS